MALHEMSSDMVARFKDPKMSLKELDQLMSSFVKYASSPHFYLLTRLIFVSWLLHAGEVASNAYWRWLNECNLVIATFRHAEAGDHVKAGFADSAYGMSKIGVWKATTILAEQIKSDPRHILINSVGLSGIILLMPAF